MILGGLYKVIKCLVLQITLDIAYIICVTKAAMYFNNPKILIWYLLVLLLGFNIKIGAKQ